MVKTALNQMLRALAAAWEIYLLLALSVFTIVDSYVGFTGSITNNDPVKHFQVTITYMTSMLSLLSLYLLRRDRMFNVGQRGSFRNLPIEQAIREARSNQRYFENVRIMASTTANIQPMLMMNTDVKINNCTVIVAQPPDEKNTLSTRVSTFVHAWMDNLHTGRISNMKIKGYEFIPMFYIIILDDNSLIFGFFTEDQKLNVRVDVGHPILIFNQDHESARLIERWTNWFDMLANRLPQHRDFQVS